MAEYPNQDPRWPDKSQFEPNTIIFEGKAGESLVKRCQCWKSDRSGQCANPAMDGMDVCQSHGGKGTEARRAIKTRRDFLEALSTHADEQTQKSINEIGIGQLAKKVLAGDEGAIKYWFDQQFGTAKTTIINEIGNREFIAIVMRITAKHLQGEAFETWLQELKSEMDAESDSTS